MKKHKYPLFSNGTEFELWSERNCDRCVKAARIIDISGRTTKCRCAIQREIMDAYFDDGRGSKKTYDMIRKGDCPNIQTEWKKYPRKPKFENQPKLFDI